MVYNEHDFDVSYQNCEFLNSRCFKNEIEEHFLNSKPIFCKKKMSSKVNKRIKTENEEGNQKKKRQH